MAHITSKIFADIFLLEERRIWASLIEFLVSHLKEGAGKEQRTLLKISKTNCLSTGFYIISIKWEKISQNENENVGLKLIWTSLIL